MNIFKLNEAVELPKFATKGSACFDLKAFFVEGEKVKVYNTHNKDMMLPIRKGSDGRGYIVLQPQYRVLIPTGLVFDIPEGHVLKVYPRSSMAIKYGLGLVNSTGIIDSDYTNELFVAIFNSGDMPINIYSGDRIAQAQLCETITYDLVETKEPITQKTDRVGGIGSTGVA